MTAEHRPSERPLAHPPQTELSEHTVELTARAVRGLRGGAAGNHCCAPFDFRMPFSSTPLGARLARLLTLHQLDEWQIPYGSGPSDTAAAVVAELAANAVHHGHLPGRDFSLRLTLSRTSNPATTLRIEVSDARTDARPASHPAPAPAEEETGRGLALVAALATRWGVHEDDLPFGSGKTVWAELGLSAHRLPDDQDRRRAADELTALGQEIGPA